MNIFTTIEFPDLVRYIIALVVIFAALFAILYTIWGGFLIILSAGKEEKVKVAVNHIRHALIGIVFIILVLFIFPLLSDLVGLPYGEYAKPAIVFETVSEISSRIFGSDIGSPIIDSSSKSSLPGDFSDL